MKDLVALLKTNNIRAISEKLKTSAGGFSTTPRKTNKYYERIKKEKAFIGFDINIRQLESITIKNKYYHKTEALRAILTQYLSKSNEQLKELIESIDMAVVEEHEIKLIHKAVSRDTREKIYPSLTLSLDMKTDKRLRSCCEELGVNITVLVRKMIFDKYMELL